jgi:cytochrome c553
MTMENFLRRHISRKRAGVVFRLGMAIALAVCGSGAWAVPQAGNPEAGAFKADDERCRECHGDHGKVEGDNESMKVPRLAGQHPDYLLKQLRDFASGARKHEFMNRVAADLDPLDAADIIAFYVQQEGKGARATGPQPRADIERLYREGDPVRGVLACAACHGADGKTSIAQPGVPGNLIPVIGGQDRHYLEEQLLNWRSGARSNSPAAIMNIAVKSLTTNELQALAEYLEAL